MYISYVYNIYIYIFTDIYYVAIASCVLHEEEGRMHQGVAVPEGETLVGLAKMDT